MIVKISNTTISLYVGANPTTPNFLFFLNRFKIGELIMTEDDTTSVFLEFKPVGNLHWIVNKNSTFSFEQMTHGRVDNKFKFIPVQNCQDNWKANLKNDYSLDPTKITRCQYIEEGNNVAEDVDPNPIELIAQEVGYGGVIVTTGSQAVINLTSTPQNLKGIFLVNDANDVVLAYCILPEPVKVYNYLQLNYNSPIIEITSTVHTQL